MKIGLVGSGGREHAIAKVLIQDRGHHSLFAFGSHKNPGIEYLSTRTELGKFSDVSNIVDFFLSTVVDYVVVGPEVPLMVGLVDVLRARGVPTIGPTQAQARLEGDKAFMRDLLDRKVGWGSARWRVVSDRREAANFISEVGQVAVKPVGLTSGKGVQVMGVHLSTEADALKEAESWIDKEGHVLLEECLVGEEFSRMLFVSGESMIPMPVAQDFKYAYDGDKGNMTGGMGAYTTADGTMPFLNPSDLAQADQLIKDTLFALHADTGQEYRGFLYGQFMLTSKGIRLIEYNVRLGDPEAINAMALLNNSDVPSLFYQIAIGELNPDLGFFVPQASVCKYLVPEGYPDHVSGPISFEFDQSLVEKVGLSVIFASVVRRGTAWQTLGSRTLAILGLGEDPGSISKRIEEVLSHVEPSALRHRKDVGDAEVIQRKVKRMQRIRAGEEK